MSAMSLYVCHEEKTEELVREIDKIRAAHLVGTQRSCGSWLPQVIERCPMLTLGALEYILNAIIAEQQSTDNCTIDACKTAFVPAVCALLAKQDTAAFRVTGLLLRVLSS